MKLRSRKSEYQHCFASPNKDYFKNIYEEQLAYRLKRREKEHCHYVLKWDSESSEESNESSGEKYEGKFYSLDKPTVPIVRFQVQFEHQLWDAACKCPDDLLVIYELTS